jgi:hypothetical protein
MPSRAHARPAIASYCVWGPYKGPHYASYYDEMRRNHPLILFLHDLTAHSL